MKSYIDRTSSHYMLNVLKGEGFHLRQIAKITGIDYHKLTRARNNEFELKESDYRRVSDFYQLNASGASERIGYADCEREIKEHGINKLLNGNISYEMDKDANYQWGWHMCIHKHKELSK